MLPRIYVVFAFGDEVVRAVYTGALGDVWTHVIQLSNEPSHKVDAWKM